MIQNLLLQQKSFIVEALGRIKKSFVVQKPTEVCGLNKKATQAEKEQKK